MAGDERHEARVVRKVVGRRQRFRRALTATEALYRRMVEQATTHAIIHLDAEGRVTTWNPGAEVINRYEAKEILGRNFACFYPAEAQAAGRPEALLRRARTEGLAIDEGWRVRRDGSQFWAMVTVTPIRDEHRRLTGFLKITLDDTERRRAAERISDLTSLYATLSQVSQLIVRASTRAELFGEAVRILVEFARFDLAWIGLPDAAGALVKVAAAHGPGLAYARGLEIPLAPAPPASPGPTAIAFREARTVVVHDWAEDPVVAPWRERAAPFGLCTSATFPVFEGGRVVAVVVLYSQVPAFFQTERVELLDSLARDLGFALDKMADGRRRIAAEAELRASEELFRASFERAIAAKSINSPDGRLLRVNEAYCRMLGYEKEELEGRSLEDFTHPEDWAATLPFIASMHAGEATGHRRAKRYLHKDGHSVWGDMSTVMVRDAQGQPLYFVTDIVDITPRKALEEALRELNEDLEARVALRTRQLESANQDLEAFAYGASHDLRAPLRVLGGFAEFLLQEGPALAEAKRDDYLRRIHAGARRMARILDDLLRLARIGQEDFAPAPVDLAAITREVVGDLEEAEPGRAVELSLAASLPALGDVRLLRMLMGNLVGNAWKFTARQAEARIEVGKEPGTPDVFFVRDNGVGFAMAWAGRIFEPFQRLHHGAEFPGTGIGLALADRVVKRHGGRIWARSAPGEGTTLFFTLEAAP